MLSKDFMMKTIDKNLTKNYNIIIVNLDGLRRDKVHLVKSLNDLTNQSFFFRKGEIRDGLTQNDNYFRVYTRMQPYSGETCFFF